MAHRGPAPKRNRQRRQSPARGDWVQLEPLAHPVIPDIDELMPPRNCLDEETQELVWPATSRRYWNAWRESPVTVKWTADDIALAVDTITGHAEAAMGGRGIPPSEVRLRMESLGLTPKGRRDSRYLLPEEKPDADVVAIHPVPDDDDPPSIRPQTRPIPEAI